jgi:cell division protein FtsI/penicillin-binding protein 2
VGLGEWRYQGRLSLVRGDGRWRVRWDPATIHPRLRPGLHLGRSRQLPARAPILAADGTSLTPGGVAIGIEPRLIVDRAVTLAAIQRFLGIDPATVAARLDAPGVQPTHFVPVVAVDEELYAKLKPDIYDVPGLVFQRDLAPRVPATRDLGSHVVGRVGPVTAELLAKLAPDVTSNDVVGLSELEASHQRELAGTASGDVQLRDAANRVLESLYHFSGTPPRPVQTTIDLAVQRAAERAVDGVDQPVAVVALQASTGNVRAVVSRPRDQFDRALNGRYPPGSSFKVVTSTALLEAGVKPDQSISCPPDVEVGGRHFRNFEHEEEPQLDFQEAFAISCNTAFVQLARRLDAGALEAAARRYGFGDEPVLGGLSAVGGAFPAPRDATELVASAIGQGRVTASPLEMATVAATVASGSWHPPTLVPDPARKPPGQALEPGVADALRALMARVVASGTGTAAAVPGQQVSGKTGTAEFGTAEPPATHAWFIGFRGDLAFAVLVEGGGVGGRVAAPLAARFLQGVPG